MENLHLFSTNVHNYNNSTENIKYYGSIISKLWSLKYDLVILWNSLSLWEHTGNIKSLVRKQQYQDIWNWKKKSEKEMGGKFIIKAGIINNKVTSECPRNNGIVFRREDEFLPSSFSGTLLSINYIHSLFYCTSADFVMSERYILKSNHEYY